MSTQQTKQDKIQQILAMLQEQRKQQQAVVIRNTIMYAAVALAAGLLLGCALFA